MTACEEVEYIELRSLHLTTSTRATSGTRQTFRKPLSNKPA
jgi:hypothetical protein